MEKYAISLVLIHLAYYLYLQIISDLYRAGHTTQNNHLEILRLRNKYKVVIKTFKKNTKLYGFAWFNTIYLNESLLTTKARGKSDPYYALKWTFFHELYHFNHKHKAKILISRAIFASIPAMFLLSQYSLIWTYVTITVYIAGAYLLHIQRQIFEKKANAYAKKLINHETED